MDRLSDPNADRLNTQISNATGYQLVASNTGHASVLANANDVRIKDSNFSITTNVNTDTKSALQVLYQRVAPNAILNDGGRADDAKCLPGTRQELIGLIENWADAIGGNRILWLSGPAGGGKTAIMKTIVERAAKRGVHTVNFFFFRGDSTRQSIQPVVSTLLYQLFQYYPNSAEVVAEIVSPRPRIFDESIAQQCKLISALSPIIRQSSPPGTPTILLVDGLDECDVDADRSQGDILRALEGLLMEDDSPFRLLVASRPEARIKMAFNHLSLHAQTIFLDEQYQPEKDIRRFVVAEFNRIKARHPSARLLPSNWPSSSDIEGIVKKSSGQFIFAATVMRYIAHASTVPSLSLERVKGILPTVNNSPFMHLDSIYIFVLLRVDDLLDAVLAMFFLKIVYNDAKVHWLCEYNCQYTPALVESCVSELSAIVKLTEEDTLDFYHASLPDFLLDKARSGKYWVDIAAFTVKMLVGTWNKSAIALDTSHDHHNCLQYDLLRQLDAPTPEITHELFKSSLPNWISYDGLKSSTASLRLDFFMEIERLYYNTDNATYEDIIFQCIPRWAQFLAYKVRQLDDQETLPRIQYREYLDYLSNGGVAEWASTVENTSIVQLRITHILEEPIISRLETPDGPGAAYLNYQWTYKKGSTEIVENCNTATFGRLGVVHSPHGTTRCAPSLKSSGEGFSPFPTPPVFTSVIPRVADTRNVPLLSVPPHNPWQDRRVNRTVSPTRRSAYLKVPSLRPPSVSPSLSVYTPRASSVSASEIQRATFPLTHQNVRTSALQTQAPGSESTQRSRVSGSGTSGSPSPRHHRVSSTAQALMTIPSCAPRSSPRQLDPTRRDHTEPSQAVSWSAGMAGQRAHDIAAAGSGIYTPSATKPMRRGLRNITPPKASVGGHAERRTMPSGSRFLGGSTVSPLGSVRGNSQHSRGRGDDEEKDDDDIILLRPAVTKDSTTNTASRLGSRSHSPIPPLHSYMSVTMRETGSRFVHGAITTARSDGDSSGAFEPTGTPHIWEDTTSPKASGGVEEKMRPDHESSRRLLWSSTSSTPGNAHGKTQHNRGRSDGERSDDDVILLRPAAANPAPRLSWRTHSPGPLLRPATSLQVNARKKRGRRHSHAKPVSQG